MISKTIKAWRERRANHAYAAGWNYAAGRLLLGELVWVFWDELDADDDLTPFERGMRDAATKWANRNVSTMA